MNIQEFLGRVLFEWGNVDITLGQFIFAIVTIGSLLLLAVLLLRRWMPNFYDREDTSQALRRRSRFIVIGLFLLLSLLAVLKIFQLDFLLLDNYRLSRSASLHVWLSSLIAGFLAFWVAGFLDWLLEEYLTQRLFRLEKNGTSIPDDGQRRFKALKPVFYCLAALFVVNTTGLGDQRLLELGAANSPTHITVRSVLNFILVISLIRLGIKLFIGFGLSRYYKTSHLDRGSQYAVNRLFTYFAYLIGSLIALSAAGLDILGLWAGAAALLVGVGIGLQQTFNDLICGVIILFERSVKVGDVLDIQGSIGTVRKIGARTSAVETRDNIMVSVPNSKLIGESVVNWSQTERKARFHLPIGVAYGSDTNQVKEILLGVAAEHKAVMKFPAPMVRFADFGNSSLDFELLFFSKEFIRIEDIKSDLRFAIDAAFRTASIEIPFPQRDLWVRGGDGINLLGGSDNTPTQ